MSTVTFDNVDSDAALGDAIFQISNDFATDGVDADDYVINITRTSTLAKSLPMIRGDGTHAITEATEPSLLLTSPIVDELT